MRLEHIRSKYKIGFVTRFLTDEIIENAIGEALWARLAALRRRRKAMSPEFSRRKIIFVHIPKTGGTSISAALFGNASLTWGHFGVRDFYAELGAEIDDYYKFCVVRNPWDRFVSAYHYLSNVPDTVTFRTKSFADLFVRGRSIDDLARYLHENPHMRRWAHFRPQSDFITLGGKVRVDRVIRFERMAIELSEMGEEVGIPELRATPHLNVSSRASSYRSYYTDTTAGLVADVYRSDIETFGYSF